MHALNVTILLVKWMMAFAFALLWPFQAGTNALIIHIVLPR